MIPPRNNSNHGNQQTEQSVQEGEPPKRRTHVSGGQSTHYRGPETTGAKHGLAQTLICTSIDNSLNYQIKTGRVVKLMSRPRTLRYLL